MTSLQDETKITNDEESANGLRPSALKQMSIATLRYAGEKGYLDEDDKIIRKYDKDGDGKFTIDEAKSMAADFRSTLLSKQMYQKVIIGMAVLLVVSWAGNFGLTFATVSLTKQLDTQGGDLTDTEGHMLATKSKGDSTHFIPEFTRDNPADLRRLEVGSWASFGLIDKSRADLSQVWADHSQGTPELVDYTVDGVNHSSTVHLNTQELGVADKNDATGTCDVYEGIEVDEDFTQQYKVECCGVDTQLCDVFVQVTSGNRKLYSTCGCCFSPMSTVIEQTKGKMLLKDLKFGDSVLAANQVFQPYVFDIHSHSSKPTEYLQLHTEVSDNDSETAPIELTPGHMIFVDGKDMPILASDVKLGDSLVGTSGPMKVTKISTVMRDGLFNTLTADATLFVDGVLASSMVDANDANYLNFGIVKIHVHTFMSRIVAPLFHSFCNKIDSTHCETQVDDGEGGAMNILMKSGYFLLKKSPLVQALGLVLLPAAGAVSLFGYYAFMGLASIAFLMSVFKALVTAKEQSAGQAKIKVA